MNHCVPDFRMEDDNSIPTFSGLFLPRKSPMSDDEIMEIIWQKGDVIMQKQSQSPAKKFRSSFPAGTPPEYDSDTRLFIHEDEMASWLNYPLDDASFDRDFRADFLNPAPRVSAPATTSAIVRKTRVVEPRPLPITTELRPPTPPTTITTAEIDGTPKVSNFLHFSRMKEGTETQPLNPKNRVHKSTIVSPIGIPVTELESRVSQIGEIGGPRNVTVKGSPSGSGAADASAEPPPQPAHSLQDNEQKRKARRADDEADGNNKDIKFEPNDAKKEVRETKRARTAEVHNLSERMRRDRINEKMKALQELVPRCNKTDKASILDEAIEYLKSLQLQVQMMSMGCNMVPMIFPGAHPYITPMGMAASQPMMPYPIVIAGSTAQTAPIPAHFNPRYPMPAVYQMQPVLVPDPSRIQS